MENQRLLSDEEIKEITGGTHRDFPGGLRICQAQDVKTLKAVGGWLQKPVEAVLAKGTFLPKIARGTRALKQGKMPEER